MFLSNRNLPAKSIPVKIVMPVRCAVMSAAMCVCAKAGTAAKTFQIAILNNNYGKKTTAQ